MTQQPMPKKHTQKTAADNKSVCLKNGITPNPKIKAVPNIKIPNIKTKAARKTWQTSTSGTASEFDKVRLFFGKGIAHSPVPTQKIVHKMPFNHAVDFR